MRRRRLALAGILAVFMVFFAGCASYTPTLVRLDASGPNTVKQVKGDLCVFTEEFGTREKCERAFDANLANDGVLPLLISFQNNGLQPYELKPMDINLREGSISLKALTAEEAASKAKKNAVTRALGWSMIVPIISIPVAATASALHTSKVNQQMANDFAAKSFTGGVVLPNKELSGFLFFELDKKRKDLAGLTLEMTSRNVTTGEVMTITSPLPAAVLDVKEEETAPQDDEKNRGVL